MANINIKELYPIMILMAFFTLIIGIRSLNLMLQLKIEKLDKNVLFKSKIKPFKLI